MTDDRPIIAIPPPYPFCDRWTSLPRRSSLWLTPSFHIFPRSEPLHNSHIPTPIPKPVTSPQPVAYPHPVTCHTHLNYAGAYHPARIDETQLDVPVETSAVENSLHQDSESEYEYGFVLTDEWAEHFSRKLKKKGENHRKRKKKKKGKISTEVELDALTYELKMGQLSQKTWQPTTQSARITFIERRLDHSFTSSFSDPLKVCLFNS
jgi:hypothetical protein